MKTVIIRVLPAIGDAVETKYKNVDAVFFRGVSMGYVRFSLLSRATMLCANVENADDVIVTRDNLNCLWLKKAVKE